MDPFSIVALALAIAGTGTATVGAIKAGDAKKKAERLAAANASIEASRERTKQIRQARIRRAEILQAGANAGVSESSSVKAGAAGAMGAAFTNIGEINSQESAAKGQSAMRQGIIDAEGISNLGSGITSLGGTIFAGADELNDIFGIKKPNG